MYKEAAEQQQAQAQPQQDSAQAQSHENDENVVDADYTVVDDDKK